MLLAVMAELSLISVGDTVRGMWHALSRRDWDGVKTFLSPDCLYVDMPVPALSARGPDDIVTRLKLGLEPLAGYENHDGLLLSSVPMSCMSTPRPGRSRPVSRGC